MSCFDVRLAVLASPDRARSLFTVRAAISFARPLLSPRRSALVSMCRYCRSRLGLDPRGMRATSWPPNALALTLTCADAATLRTTFHAWRRGAERWFCPFAEDHDLA